MNREIFACPEILGYTKALINGQARLQANPQHASAAKQVLESIASGQFELPRGAQGAFSQSQFSNIHAWLKAFPVRARLVDKAEAFSRALPSLTDAPKFEIFGSWANSRFTDPLCVAENLHYKCPRKPLFFKAGQFGPSNLCDLVDDMHSSACRLEDEIEILASQGFLRQSEAIAPKVDLLRRKNRVDLLDPLIVSVHRVFLGTDGRRELDKVKYHGGSADAFLEFLRKRASQNLDANRTHWLNTFKVLRNISAVLCNSSSFNHGHLTRILRSELGSSFAVAKDPPVNGGGYFIKTSTHLELGRGERLSSCFEVVNWVAALEERMGDVQPDVHGYWELVAHAKSRVVQLRESLNHA